MVFVAAVFIVSSAAQQMETPSSDGSFWVNFWATAAHAEWCGRRSVLPERQDVLASNNDDRPVNPDALDENALWLRNTQRAFSH
jgi:hypothetical protein